jgi:hypothetical protein
MTRLILQILLIAAAGSLGVPLLMMFLARLGLFPAFQLEVFGRTWNFGPKSDDTTARDFYEGSQFDIVRRESAAKSEGPSYRAERARFAQLGRQHYETLRSDLEAKHRGEYVVISVNTGKYTTSRDDSELKAFAGSLRADDFLWMTRVGLI